MRVEKLRRRMVRLAKWSLAHDDSPCTSGVLLVEKDGGRWCPACQIHPDMQSTCLVACCPDHGVKLEKMICPTCGEKFQRPLLVRERRMFLGALQNHPKVTPAMFKLITGLDPSKKLEAPPAEWSAVYVEPVIDRLMFECHRALAGR